MNSKTEPRIGIALGGGGVRGLAHLPLLAVLDEMKIQPKFIIGTSMGAIIGALYASGVSANEIEKRVRQHIILKDDSIKSIVKKGKSLTEWVRAFGLDFRTGGWLKADGLFKHLFSEIQSVDFNELNIEFQAVACNYQTAEEFIFSSGSVLDAVRASMAVPGVLAPVRKNGLILVDGGVVNNLAYEKIPDHCDLSIALDLTNLPTVGEKGKFSSIDIAVGALDILQIELLRQKLNIQQPDILVRPTIEDVGLFDFNKIEAVLEAGAEEAQKFKQTLSQYLDTQSLSREYRKDQAS